MRAVLAQRLEAMADFIRPLRTVMVAYSGGVDSTLVLEVAHQTLGAGCSGVIARSPSLPGHELDAALALARGRGVAVEVVDTREMEVDGYRENGPDRCYYCKTELYSLLGKLSASRGVAGLLDGFNRDDRSDWRPGRRAASEWAVRSPLDEVGMGKDEVREAARELGLSNWAKPAAACLSSRIPYGVPVTIEALERVGAAEEALRGEGFVQLRVRDRERMATIEVGRDEIARLREPARWRRVERRLASLGYISVGVDEEGYRRGSLNQATALTTEMKGDGR